MLSTAISCSARITYSPPCINPTKGEAETDLTGDESFDRAVVGLKATVFPEMREAVEAGVDEDEMENQYLKATIKNVFGAPPPPEGTTGCGEDGELHSNKYNKIGAYN